MKRPERLPGAVEPTRHLYDRVSRHVYVGSHATNIKARFDAIRAEQAKPQEAQTNVQPINHRRGMK